MSPLAHNRIRLLFASAALAIAAVGCSGEQIVNTDEPRPTTQANTSTPPPAAPSAAHLVNAFDYVAHPHGAAVYYFTTPSGRWACAIVPRVKAGCQSATGWASGMGISGAPTSVPDASGQDATPNAVVVERQGDARFVALEEAEFAADTAKTLDFNRVLNAAGFRCNVQESGVSCMSEASGNGFTFSAQGFAPHYTEVPPTAP
ncbi:hypothetical protein [Mycolicibacterium pulveris]|uniref:hypothetical protein n=1 Tax=Mycolicibacterium pulveris TaxID=36813 RepID=UPI003CE727E4